MAKKASETRYATHPGVCRECKETGLNCEDFKKCAPVRGELRDFGGVRLTADGFDCALPVTIDSHSTCAYECLYCFSDNIFGHGKGAVKPVGQTSLKAVENIFAGRGGAFGDTVRQALRYDKRNAAGYPTAVQLGGLCDAGDSIEQNQGWLLDFIRLAIKYNQPVRMSTKGAIFQIKEYRDAIAQAPHLFWVAFSMITDDDVVMRRVDRFAPDATQRLETMKILSRLGVKTSLRLRPIMLGITDRRGAYKSLINKAADAGAGAISYEVGFYPSVIPKISQWKWKLLNQIAGHEYKKIYASFGKMQACTRPSYLWTENIMHHIAEIAHARGMTIGISDPVWKQLGEAGCCCGILPTDEVFGNWEVENATNALLCAKRGELKEIRFEHINPTWSKIRAAILINQGAGAHGAYMAKYETWEDKLRRTWNDLGTQRSVMNYFQGALQPTGIDEHGDRIYKYVGLERKHIKTEWQTDW